MNIGFPAAFKSCEVVSFSGVSLVLLIVFTLLLLMMVVLFSLTMTVLVLFTIVSFFSLTVVLFLGSVLFAVSLLSVVSSVVFSSVALSFTVSSSVLSVVSSFVVLSSVGSSVFLSLSLSSLAPIISGCSTVFVETLYAKTSDLASSVDLRSSKVNVASVVLSILTTCWLPIFSLEFKASLRTSLLEFPLKRFLTILPMFDSFPVYSILLLLI